MAKRVTVARDVTAWPSLTDTAALLRIHKATVSRQVRRGRVEARPMGLGRARQVVPPIEVLRLGRIYQRVPIEELERHLASFLADRAQTDATVVRQDLAAAVSDANLDKAPGVPAARGQVPAWMEEFERLSAPHDLDAESALFTAISNNATDVYAGTYREADDVTLKELTGLDPAVFRS